MPSEIGVVGFQSAVDLATSVIETLLKGASKRKEVKTASHGIARAVGVEIGQLVIAVSQRYEWWNRQLEDPPGWLPPLIPFFTEAYERFHEDVRQLPAGLLGPALRFYGYLRFVNAQGEVRAEYLEHHREKDFHATYLWSLRSLVGIGSDTLEFFKAWSTENLRV